MRKMTKVRALLGVLAVMVWVCPVSTDGLPLSHSVSSHSSLLVV